MKRRKEEVAEILEVQSKKFEEICESLGDIDIQCDSYLTGVKDKDFFRIRDNLLYIEKFKEILGMIKEEEKEDFEKVLKKLYNHKEYFETSIRLNEKIVYSFEGFSEELLELFKITNENNKRLIKLFKEIFDDLLYKIRQAQMRARFY